VKNKEKYREIRRRIRRNTEEIQEKNKEKYRRRIRRNTGEIQEKNKEK
jgi:hypothetical protein